MTHSSNLSPVKQILRENRTRKEAIRRPFNPVSGVGSPGRRVAFSLPGLGLPPLMIPAAMAEAPLMKAVREAGSVDAFLRDDIAQEGYEAALSVFLDAFIRLRSRYDFPFWCAAFVRIQSKEPGEGEVPFILTRPQRKFVAKLEEIRCDGRPIRLVLLKARQWGGSTVSQLYMAWLQLVHRRGLNSVIVSQTKKTSYAIKDMYDRALRSYPAAMLHPLGEEYSENEPKMVGVGLSGDYKRVPQRDCKITIASYEAPDSIRGDSYSLVHCSEVGLWAPTAGKTPDSVVRAACSGVLHRPYTMIIYESTANGTDNFFQREYDAAKSGRSLFEALFVAWYEIDLYSSPFSGCEEEERFAERLWNERLRPDAPTSREEPGSYLWWLWKQGATLEAIKWYVAERAGKESHAVMASEYPTDDDEAFQHSGATVFDRSQVLRLKATCRPPKYTGELYAGSRRPGNRRRGSSSSRRRGGLPEWNLSALKFRAEPQGCLRIWNFPDGYGEADGESGSDGEMPAEKITGRYLAVVDIGGRSARADYSVILVIDRLPMAEGEKPVVVAQWYGHTDMDLLARKAAEIAAFYDNALLVIESNTLDTRNPERDLEGGDQSHYLFVELAEIYPNLYTRSAGADSVGGGKATKYGFHTNVRTKPMIIAGLQRAIREEAYIERDERCISEYLFYEKRPNGSFGAAPGKHDDLLMTRAIGLHICFNEMEMPAIISAAPCREAPSLPFSEACF